MSTVYLNGKFMPMASATVPVLDRGWIFGDGIYEVIPVYNGHLFRMPEHLQRLQNNLDAIQIPSPFSQEKWHQLASDLIAQNTACEAAAVYLQVTRGVAAREHTFPETVTPSVFMMLQSVDHAGIQQLRAGIRAITHEDIRWKYCNIKSISLLSNVLLKQEAKRQGADEALLLRDGNVNEGSASNLFIVRDGTLITPPKSSHLLPGITRDLILELADRHGLPYQEQAIPSAGLSTADEIWVSSSTKEILPVIELDGNSVGSGQPGSCWARMLAYFQQFKAGFNG